MSSRFSHNSLSDLDNVCCAIREELSNLRAIPSEIRFLTNLKDLDMSVDRYETIGSFMHVMTVLKNNRNVQSIPDEIGDLVELEYLMLCKSTMRFAMQVTHENLKRFFYFEKKRWYLSLCPLEFYR